MPADRLSGRADFQARGQDIAFYSALLATGLALGPALAHLFEFPNKIDMARDEYFVVQSIYRGWALLGFVLLAQLVSLATAAIFSRDQGRIFWLTMAAIGCVIGAQIVFWTFTYPANVATANWTSVPDDWERLRSQWEYSHAAGACFQLLGFCALIRAVLARGRMASH